MPDVHPLGNGKATHHDKDHIEATFPLHSEMAGWRMTGAEIDESGYFITISWEREGPRIRYTGTAMFEGVKDEQSTPDPQDGRDGPEAG